MSIGDTGGDAGTNRPDSTTIDDPVQKSLEKIERFGNKGNPDSNG
jgi:hypothetical protein